MTNMKKQNITKVLGKMDSDTAVGMLNTDKAIDKLKGLSNDKLYQTNLHHALKNNSIGSAKKEYQKNKADIINMVKNNTYDWNSMRFDAENNNQIEKLSTKYIDTEYPDETELALRTAVYELSCNLTNKDYVNE